MNAAILIVEASVRYWEDAAVNGVEDTTGSAIPLRIGDTWCPMIELATGQILDWPKGTTADVHYKICDAGEYWLADSQRNKLAKWKGYYVPDSFLCHGDEGYGDYIIFKIDGDGKIQGWKCPEIDMSEWLAARERKENAT